jgi:hypothetical protein
MGRLACVDEPTGRASFGYDELGNRALERRVVDGLVAEKRTRFAPSGLPLHTGFDDSSWISTTTRPGARSPSATCGVHARRAGGAESAVATRIR